MIGSAFGDVKNCENSGNVVGEGNYVGGITGQASGNITNCRNIGNVVGKSRGVGGILGLAYKNVDNCINSGNVESSGSQSVGGIMGDLAPSCTISSCSNTGNVTAKNAGYVAGIVGLMAHTGNETHSTVQQCYNSGRIEGKDQVGGIVRMGRRIFRIWNSN